MKTTDRFKDVIFRIRQMFHLPQAPLAAPFRPAHAFVRKDIRILKERR